MLADGSSDEPLGRHVVALARRHEVRLDVVTPEFDRLNMPTGRRVRDRLERMLELDPDFDALVVHRDAEGAPCADRLNEILPRWQLSTWLGRRFRSSQSE